VACPRCAAAPLRSGGHQDVAGAFRVPGEGGEHRKTSQLWDLLTRGTKGEGTPGAPAIVTSGAPGGERAPSRA